MTNAKRRQYLHGLIDYIEEQEKLGTGRLDMSEWHIKLLDDVRADDCCTLDTTGKGVPLEQCGTVHCLAGWAQMRDGLKTLRGKVFKETARYSLMRKLKIDNWADVKNLTQFGDWESENRLRYNAGDKIGAARAQVDHIFGELKLGDEENAL